MHHITQVAHAMAPLLAIVVLCPWLALVMSRDAGRRLLGVRFESEYKLARDESSMLSGVVKEVLYLYRTSYI